MQAAAASGRVLNHKPRLSKRQAVLGNPRVARDAYQALAEPHNTTIGAHLLCVQPMGWKTPVALVAILAFLAMHDLCVAEVSLSTRASMLSHASVCPMLAAGRAACLLRQDMLTAATAVLLLSTAWVLLLLVLRCAFHAPMLIVVP
jgi:hypothetical protein